MSDETYGALLGEAERHLIRAIFTTHEAFCSPDQAHQAADDYAQILLSLKGGVRTLAGVAKPNHPAVLPPSTSAAAGLFHALDDAISRFAGSTEARSWRGEWNDCARAISAATALLASHLGPNRDHRTPDAALIDDSEARRTALHRLAVFTLTAAEGGRHLALRLRDASIRFPQPGKLATTAKWLIAAQASVGEAAAAVVIDHRTAAGRQDLAMLQPAPLLVPTRDSDPVAAARKSFDRIRLFAHRQARGGLGAGIDAIRAYATAAMLIAMHGHAIAAAANEKHSAESPSRRAELTSVRHALLAMRQPWAELLSAAESCASTVFSPPLLGREVACLSTSLATITRDSSRWRVPTEILPTMPVEERLLQLVHHLSSRLPDLATAAKAITERLYEHGDLLVPTRERADLDLPYRWAPISAERLAALRGAGRAAQATSAKAASTSAAVLYTSISRQQQAVKPASLATPGRATLRRLAR